MDKAVILARVSTTGQAEQGTSLNDQEDRCRQFVDFRHAEIHKVYREDGKSGALYFSRDELQKAIRDIEEKRATLFVTCQLDRSGRELEVLTNIRKRVNKAGGQFLLANGMEFPDTPVGDLMFNQLASYAQFEKATIRERTVNGRIRRAKEGQQPCRAWTSFGCHVVNKQDVIRGDYPADQIGRYVWLDSSRWVKEMYFKYASGAYMNDIGRWLKANGVLTPEGLSNWSDSTIRRILSNPVYKGEPAFGRTRHCVDDKRKGKLGKHGKILVRADYTEQRPESEWIKLQCEPLVPVSVWNECQRRIAENQAKHGGNPKRRYLLGGMVRCPVCKKIMGGSKSRTGRYYTCPNDRGCKWRANADRTEEYVTLGVITAAESREMADAALRAYKAVHGLSSSDAEQRSLTSDLETISRKERALVEAELEARMESRATQPYKDRLASLADQRAALQAKLEDFNRRTSPASDLPTPEAIAKVLDNVRQALLSPHLTPVEKNEILSAVVADVRPSEASTEIVLALRSFIFGLMSETYSRILIRVKAGCVSLEIVRQSMAGY